MRLGRYCLVGLLLWPWAASAAPSAAPSAAIPYQRTLTREARLLWGLDAPVAVMAGQIEQESAWNPLATSPYAAGLAQFTLSTASWISGAYAQELGSNQPFNPEWAIRALVRYDYDLGHALGPVADECSWWAMALSAYNGGATWLERDRNYCTSIEGCSPLVWFNNVELYTRRGPGAAKENRGYPRRILFDTQLNYTDWGRTVPCFLAYKAS